MLVTLLPLNQVAPEFPPMRRGDPWGGYIHTLADIAPHIPRLQAMADQRQLLGEVRVSLDPDYRGQASIQVIGQPRHDRVAGIFTNVHLDDHQDALMGEFHLGGWPMSSVLERLRYGHDYRWAMRALRHGPLDNPTLHTIIAFEAIPVHF